MLIFIKMMKAQFMWSNRTKFLLFGIIVLAFGISIYMDLLPFELPFDTSNPLFDLMGFGITLPILFILVGIILMLISRILPY